MNVTISRVANGMIEAVLEAGTDAPDLMTLNLGDTVIGPVELGQPSPDGTYPLTAAIPAHVISDGITLLTIKGAGAPDPLAHVTIVAGQPMDSDLHSEVALLRAELDLLKAAFRRKFRT